MTYSLIVLSFFLMASRPGFAQAAADIPIAPDAALQAKIDRAARAVANSKLPWIERLAEVEELRRVAQEAPERLIRQVLYYASRENVDGARAWGALYVPNHFNLGKQVLASAVIPYIGTEDPRLSELVRASLDTIEGYTASRPPDYSYYLPNTRSRQDTPPLGLVRHMFTRDPSEALRRCIVVYGSPPARAYSPANEELRWADHIVNDAIKNAKFLRGFSRAPAGARDALVTLERLTREEATFQLENLSKSDDWWVRLYVAEIVTQHLELGNRDVVARLGRDKNPLVREAMDFTKEKPKAPAKSPAGKTAPP